MAQSDPIAGITIDVDPGNAVDPESIDHAARAFLNRRLREVGYDRARLPPLHIDVDFQSVGVVEYVVGDKVVQVDDVLLEIVFRDADGRELQTVSIQPEMHESEEFQYDAGISLNIAAYDRAVSEILEVALPAPEELR
jgi:hypothetical protein